jgi:hypothetical protein
LISSTNSKLEELSKVQEPEKIEIVDYDTQLSELRKQRENAEPKFSITEIYENGEINQKITELHNSVFIPEPLIPLLPEIEKPVLVDIEGLKKELEGVQFSRPDTILKDENILQIKTKIAKIKALQLQVDNYDDNVKTAKCTLCQVCVNPDCQFKKVQVSPLENLKWELSGFMTIELAEKTLLHYENELIDYLRDFEANKESEILRLTNEITSAKMDNNVLSVEYEKSRISTSKNNAEITAKNFKIQNNNSNGIANFETNKAQKIAELKKQLHQLPAFDYSEIDTLIFAVKFNMNDQQLWIDKFNELNGAYIYAQNRTVILTDELKHLKEALYGFERELIKIEKAESDYYNDFESLINAEMPENIKVSLFKKNLSNDDRSEVFEIEFNGSIYAGNGKTIAFYIWLCSWFQSKFVKDLPIFIDEAIILNEKLYSDVKNTVILMRNDECKTLKISELK